MNRRINLVLHSIRKLNVGGSYKNWLYNCFCPTCGVMARLCIEYIKESRGYYEVKLYDCEQILYYDANLDLHSLYQTIFEQQYSWQWHYYNIPQTRIKEGDIVIDCGSAEGVFPLLNYRTAKHIYAFEPLPEYIAGLEKTFSRIPNVSIVDIALGGHVGEAFLQRDGLSSRIVPYETDTAVRVDTIDNYCLKNNLTFNYLKADIEGYELELLAGAAESIKKFRPKIAITTYHRRDHAQEISRFLRKINSSYNIITKGIEDTRGVPVMLHAW